MSSDKPLIRKSNGEYRWQEVDLLAYKQDGSAPFKDVTRQVLFDGKDMQTQLRYFEVAPGGWTTLERHNHVHAVMVIRGKGQCLVGDKAWDIGLHDLVRVPPMTWHQVHAATDEPLGFLCMVASDRDRPQLPAEHEHEAITRPLKETRG